MHAFKECIFFKAAPYAFKQLRIGGIHFIYNSNARTLRLPKPLQHGFIRGAEAIVRRYHGNYYIAALLRLPLRAHHILSQLILRLMYAGSIQKNKLIVLSVYYRAYTVARGLAPWGNYGDLLAHKTVEQSGFTRIGPPYYGCKAGSERHLYSYLLNCYFF